MRGGRELVRPRALDPGATIGICAPSGPVEAAAVAAGERWLEEEGFRVLRAPHLEQRCGYLAGPDVVRAADFLELLRDPGVDAILFARGGYGVGRWIPQLDPVEVVAARKPIVGYSDATLFLLWLRCAGLVSLHGPMLERSDLTPEARARLVGLLRGDPQAEVALRGHSLRAGTATGPLVGGSLSLVVASLGTPWEIDTRGAVLFLEEYQEAPYAVDRKLVQLRDAGKLSAAAGVAVGALVECASERYPEVEVEDVVRDLLLREVDGPVVCGLPIGHIRDNRAVGIGARVSLDGAIGELALEEPVVDPG